MTAAPAVTAPSAPSGPADRPRRHWGSWLGLGAAVLIVGAVVWASAGRSSGGPAYDPTSTGTSGAKALALLVGRLGGTVDTSGALPPVGHGVALVLVDHLTSSSRQALESWVRSGGTLVIADVSSDLAGVAPAEGSTPDSAVNADGTLSPDCPAPWVAGIDQIDPAGANLLAVPAGATERCFDTGDAYFAVERSVGRGVVVSLASPDLWTNANLATDANSVLAADLLVPEPGTTLAWLTGPEVGGGQQSLIQLLPARVDEMLIGGIAAFVVVCAWRARRLGRPVVEELPVVVPGSELVGAVSRLLARNQQRDHAAQLLRDALRRDVAMRVAVTSTTPPDVVAAMVATRTGRPSAAVQATMYGPVPADDGELIELARAVEEIRQEVRGAYR